MMQQFYEKLDDYIKAGTYRDDGLDILEFTLEKLGAVPEEVIQHISKKTGIWDLTLRNTMEFYPRFRNLKERRHLVITVCHGRNCGPTNRELMAALEEYMEEVGKEELLRRNPEIEHLKFDTQHCFAKCNKGPVMKVGEQFYFQMNLEKLKEILNI
ncbi:MAG: NAD(P)H-dependent oxidoreductase subunit E [Fusobacteriaceae bacterium]